MGNLSGPISVKEIEFIIKTFLTKKTPDSNDFTSEFDKRLGSNDTNLKTL